MVSLWHGNWPGCRRRLAALCRWAGREGVREMAGVDKLQRQVAGLLGYLGRNEAALVPHCRIESGGQRIRFTPARKPEA